MDDVIFRFIEEKSFEDAVLIVGLPGIGSVALLAADQLISELGQKNRRHILNASACEGLCG